ncbi:FAD-dependent oxidoreductase [Fusibacter sp. 3D3]|uniref:FAD-dependent oxidoreductase n=1 Tax=Fusibacter sp. 3D3 TaxID=1048380 RepID=UPI000858C130|nr:FAD-dependent oxidoreductase [Fusibacter sp. 3D3]GAU78083.1 thioredoxin reductase [Fusibacter sp. 3D3]
MMDFNLNLDFSSQKKSESVRENSLYDLLIIGSGPAGLNAALYAKRKGLEVAILSVKMGGQVLDTSSVENYLGIQGATGESLVHDFISHVNTLAVPIIKDESVKSIEKIEDQFQLTLGNGAVYKSKALIVATGSKPRQLGVKGEAEYSGRGVAYCAICDGPLFEGRDVIIAGGGNSAVEAAIDLSKIAKTVTLVHRSQLRADQIVIDKLNSAENVKIHLETQITEVVGENLVTGVNAVDKKTNETLFIPAEGVFVEIGYLPNNELVKDLVSLNESGEIIVNAQNETSLKGLYAAGDVTDTPYKQIVIAASEGAKAALSANDYINHL